MYISIFYVLSNTNDLNCAKINVNVKPKNKVMRIIVKVFEGKKLTYESTTL